MARPPEFVGFRMRRHRSPSWSRPVLPGEAELDAAPKRLAIPRIPGEKPDSI
jgi:hypothetical protein